MIYAISGVIIGIVMGLTGAGGALVAIPLFIQFLGMGLKEASVYSLIAVVMASLINFVTQRKLTDYKVSGFVLIFSAIGSYISVPMKKIMPEIGVAALLSSIALYALWSLWFSKTTQAQNHSTKPHHVLSVMIGLILGSLTTLTGLGGGVLMMPVFMKFYKFDQAKAVATSLFVVAFSSLLSLLIQSREGFQIIIDVNLFYLSLGILASALLLKKLMSSLPNNYVLLTRKIVFSFVVLLALLKIF
ncbi:MAG: sulfite exporter TauE/SafE family protein [Bacteriovoracaceae bacterium]|nr:sulfite exporter TauE/SafE family protein [Bacteriovoracaceae bacterium]